MSLYDMKQEQATDCFFCNTPNAKMSSGTLDGSAFDCPMCGKYLISRTEQDELRFCDSFQEKKLHIAQLLTERSLIDNNQTRFISLNVENLLKHYPLDMFERLDRALLNLSRLNRDLYDEIVFRGLISTQDQEQEFIKNILLLFATRRTYRVVLEHMTQEGWLRVTSDRDLNNKYAITPKGWGHIRDLRKRPAGDAKQVFIAMRFNDDCDKFLPAMKKAADETGFKPYRSDKVEHNNKICDEIIAEIRKSQFLIADVTERNTGVYFEAGYAMGLGIPVIWLVKKTKEADMHFDTRQYAHINYTNEDDLYERLKARIEATILTR